MAKQAGWYPDPGKRPGRRWWDGAAWSPWVAPFDGEMRIEVVDPRWRPPGSAKWAPLVVSVCVGVTMVCWFVVFASLMAGFSSDEEADAWHPEVAVVVAVIAHVVGLGALIKWLFDLFCGPDIDREGIEIALFSLALLGWLLVAFAYVLIARGA